jgi:hypothetical protein
MLNQCSDSTQRKLLYDSKGVLIWDPNHWRHFGKGARGRPAPEPSALKTPIRASVAREPATGTKTMTNTKVVKIPLVDADLISDAYQLPTIAQKHALETQHMKFFQCMAQSLGVVALSAYFKWST